MGEHHDLDFTDRWYRWCSRRTVRLLPSMGKAMVPDSMVDRAMDRRVDNIHAQPNGRHHSVLGVRGRLFRPASDVHALAAGGKSVGACGPPISPQITVLS